MTKELEEKMKTIAEYDGWRLVNDSPNKYPNGYYRLEDIWAGNWQIDNMEYLTSLDWLHGVIKKLRSDYKSKYWGIENSQKAEELYEKLGNSLYDAFDIDAPFTNLIENVFEAIVFLNQQKK